MSRDITPLKEQLFRMLSSKGYQPKIVDTSNKEVQVPEEADLIRFIFTKDGKKYGPVDLTIEGNSIVIYLSDGVLSSPDFPSPGAGYDDSWNGLRNHIRSWGHRFGLGLSIKNQDHLQPDMAKRHHMKTNKIAEGYYPMGKQASYNDSVPNVKIVIQHTRKIEEGEQRFRNVEKIFIENTVGERILAPTLRPGVARIYARHIAEGGLPHDDRWKHLSSLVEEYTKMAGFVRATRAGQFNESAQKLVNEGINHYLSLRESLGKMTGHRGYNAYFEAWSPALMEEQIEEANLNELFVQETLDPRIENVLPILSKLHKKVNEMSEVTELAEWADRLIGEDESLTSNNPVAIPEQDVAEVGGNLGKALDTLSGGWSGWHKEEEMSTPDMDYYSYDDGEGNFYAGGSIEHNLKTDEVTVNYHGEYDDEVKGTFKNMGDAMRALKGAHPGSHRGRAPNFDRLGQRTPPGPDDLRKTDRTGRKGTLGGSYTNQLKGSIQANKGRLGPKGVLPEQDMAEDTEQLSLEQLATISDEALDNAYHYGRSSPGNTFGWQANLKSAAFAKQMIDKGVTDIEAISDAIHKGWNVTAKAFVQNPDQFADTEKLKAAGKLEAKLQQREKLMNIGYTQLPDDEQEKDRVVARALLDTIKGQQGVAEGLKQTLRKFDPTIKARIRGKSQDQTNQGLDTIQHLADLDLTSDDMVSRAMKPNTYFKNAERYAKLANKGVAEAKADPLGAWIAHKNGTEARKFKTREGAKKYVASHEGFTVSSSEAFHDTYRKKDAIKGQQGMAEGKSDYKIKSIGTDAKGDYYISPSTGKKVYKSGVKKGDHENPKTGEHKGVNEERTETKDKEGNVIGWQDGTDWKKSKGKDPRGKVTNLSDKARRETEKAEKEKVKEGNDDLARILTIMNHRR